MDASEKILKDDGTRTENGAGTLAAHSVGATAGEVWNYLNQNGECSLIKLKSGTMCSAGRVHLALGWLLREGKIEISYDGGQLQARLKG